MNKVIRMLSLISSYDEEKKFLFNLKNYDYAKGQRALQQPFTYTTQDGTTCSDSNVLHLLAYLGRNNLVSEIINYLEPEVLSQLIVGQNEFQDSGIHCIAGAFQSAHFIQTILEKVSPQSVNQAVLQSTYNNALFMEQLFGLLQDNEPLQRQLFSVLTPETIHELINSKTSINSSFMSFFCYLNHDVFYSLLEVLPVEAIRTSIFDVNPSGISAISVVAAIQPAKTMQLIKNCFAPNIWAEVIVQQNSEGMTPIQLSTMNPDTAVCAMLIDDLPEQSLTTELARTSANGVTLYQDIISSQDEALIMALSKQMTDDEFMAAVFATARNNQQPFSLRALAYWNNPEHIEQFINRIPSEYLNQAVAVIDSDGWNFMHVLACRSESHLFHNLLTQLDVDAVSKISEAVIPGGDYDHWNLANFCAHFLDANALLALLDKLSDQVLYRVLSNQCKNISAANWTPMHHMVAKPNPVGIDILASRLDTDAFDQLMSTTNNESMTPLFLLLYNATTDLALTIIQALSSSCLENALQHIANTSYSGGITLLHLLVMYHNITLLQAIEAKCGLEAVCRMIMQVTTQQNFPDSNPLHLAACATKEVEYQYLLDSIPQEQFTALMSTPDSFGANTLHYVLCFDSVEKTLATLERLDDETLNLLLTQIGNTTTLRNVSPLFIAMSNQTSKVNMVILSRMSPEALNQMCGTAQGNGGTILSSAMSWQEASMIEHLLDNMSLASLQFMVSHLHASPLEVLQRNPNLTPQSIQYLADKVAMLLS